MSSVGHREQVALYFYQNPEWSNAPLVGSLVGPAQPRRRTPDSVERRHGAHRFDRQYTARPRNTAHPRTRSIDCDFQIHEESQSHFSDRLLRDDLGRLGSSPRKLGRRCLAEGAWRHRHRPPPLGIRVVANTTAALERRVGRGTRAGRGEARQMPNDWISRTLRDIALQSLFATRQ